MTLKEFGESCDPRLRGKAIMVTAEGLVMARIESGWYLVREDMSVVIDLAPVFPHVLPPGVHTTLPNGPEVA